MLEKSLADKFPLYLREDGTFRVLCVSDFHAPCGRRWDARLRRGLEMLVEKHDPDLVMVLGDLTHDDEGVGSTELLREYIADVMGVCEERGIAWAHIPGNHDREDGIPTEIFSAFPHCLSVKGPDELSGYGTYMIPVLDRESGEVRFCVWAFDSHMGLGTFAHEYGLDGDCDLMNIPFTPEIYDGVHPNQAAWYYDLSEELERKYGHKIPGIMVMHAPVTEFLLIPRNPSDTDMDGVIRESVGAAVINSGLFAAAYERGDVKLIVSGHDHINSFSGKYMGITLAEDASLGYDVYGDDDLRGGRLCVFSEDGEISSSHVYLADIGEVRA